MKSIFICILLIMTSALSTTAFAQSGQATVAAKPNPGSANFDLTTESCPDDPPKSCVPCVDPEKAVEKVRREQQIQQQNQQWLHDVQNIVAG